jgi:hypothetical protein
VSYRCGLDSALAALMGVQPGPPCLTCDDCGRLLLIGANGRRPPKWFLDGKAAPGWRLVSQGGVRRDYCGTCKDKEQTP